MALPLAASLTPAEIAFLCEMESVTVVPRQRLDTLQLLGGPTPVLRPPYRATLPLWLALLLKRQRRASIAPPPWLHPDALQLILDREMSTPYQDSFTSSHPLTQHSVTPPFQESSTATAPAEALPFHYLEMAHLLITHCSDEIPDFQQVQRLLRDLREIRLAKLRGLVPSLSSGAGVNMSGFGALELGESRTFLTGVVDGLRKLGASRESAIKERLDEGEREGFGRQDDDGSDMEL